MLVCQKDLRSYFYRAYVFFMYGAEQTGHIIILFGFIPYTGYFTPTAPPVILNPQSNRIQEVELGKQDVLM